ncbi:hypothetical protein ABT324_13775 [Saccharopolyspora sp. NPDC000359]|uniref:hypothetical protein n=1 Tax=Saccharopolyspora sp. NPDC000359 TaxID=3154251 RepID=UPI00331B9615
MDVADFMNRTDAILEGFRDRLPAREYNSLVSAARAGEQNEVLDNILAFLQKTGAPVSRRESDELRAVMSFYQLPVTAYAFINDWENIVAALTIVDDAPERAEQAPPVGSGPPVAVYDNPDFGRTLRTQVGLHIDLPPQLFEPFLDHFTTSVGVGVEINLARTNPDQYLRQGKVHQPTEVETNFVPMMIMAISEGSIWGGGILLRGFEQWWTKHRTDAERFIQQVPMILAAEQTGDDNFHIALADLSAPTAAQVVAILLETQVGGVSEPLPPVPVFRYPTA